MVMVIRKSDGESWQLSKPYCCGSNGSGNGNINGDISMWYRSIICSVWYSLWHSIWYSVWYSVLDSVWYGMVRGMICVFGIRHWVVSVFGIHTVWYVASMFHLPIDYNMYVYTVSVLTTGERGGRALSDPSSDCPATATTLCYRQCTMTYYIMYTIYVLCTT